METRAPYVLVGAIVIVLLGLLVVAVLWIARVQFNQEFAYYDIYFSGSVTGLNQGSTVRYNGIPVGRVAEIRLDPQDPTRVRVTVELQGGTVVKTDVVAALELQGLTGGAFVNLTGGSRESPSLERLAGNRYPVIASRASGLQQVVANAPEALARLITLGDQLNAMLNEQNRQAFAETLDNLRKVTGGIANQSDKIDSGIADGAAALHDLRTVVDQLQKLTAPGGEAPATLKTVNDAAKNFDALAKRLDAMVAENQPQFKDFTRRGFDQFEQLVAQAQQLVVQLSRLAESIERDPSRFLYGDRREGYQPR